MSPEESARRLADLLYVRISAAGLSLRDLDRYLGWTEDYLGQALRGNVLLRVSHVYAVLAALTYPAWRFFSELHDPGGELGGAAAVDPRLLEVGNRLSRLLRKHGKDAVPPGPPAAPSAKAQADLILARDRADRLSTLLRMKLRGSGLPKAEISDRLGRGPHYLGRLLRRRPDFSVVQVYALLAAVEVDPGAFFTELHPPDKQAGGGKGGAPESGDDGGDPGSEEGEAGNSGEGAGDDGTGDGSGSGDGTGKGGDPD